MDDQNPSPSQPDLNAAKTQLETLMALKECMQQLHAELEYLRLMIKLRSTLN